MADVKYLNCFKLSGSWVHEVSRIHEISGKRSGLATNKWTATTNPRDVESATSQGLSLQAQPLLSLAAQVAGEHRGTDVLDAIVGGLAAQPGVALARIWLLAPGDLCQNCALRAECPDQTQCFHLVASAGGSRDGTENWSSIQGGFQRIPVGNRKVGVIGKSGNSVLIQDIAQDNQWVVRPDWVKKEEIRSFAGHPLVSSGKILGVLGLFSREQLSEQESAWLRMFADQAAVAITNAQAFETLQRAQAADEKRAQELKQVIDLAPLHMFIWEADANVSYGNRAAHEYFGPFRQSRRWCFWTW